jgi:hypothetical protein
MSTVLKGTDSIIEILIDSVWTPVFCGKDLSVEFNPEFVLRTGPNSVSRERIPRLEDWTVSVAGLTKITNEETDSIFRLWLEAVRRSLQSIRAYFINAEGTEKVLEFQAYIGPSQLTGPVNQFDQASVTFIVSGGLGDLSDPETITPTDYTELSDWWGTTNGNNYIDGTSSGETDGTNYTLETTDIVLYVSMEGTGYRIVSGTPANGTLECSLDLTNHKVNFPSDIIFDGSQTVTVIWKRPV